MASSSDFTAPTSDRRTGKVVDRAQAPVRRSHQLHRTRASQVCEGPIGDVVEIHRGLAESIARPYRRSVSGGGDLRQVAFQALVRVADSHEYRTEEDFLAHAVPAIRRAVRRYARDQGLLGAAPMPPRAM